MLWTLKWTQITLAAVVAVSTLVTFFPSVEMLLLLPFCLLYLVWAVRAIRDRRWSMWLAGVTTSLVAVLLGTIVVTSDLLRSSPAETTKIPSSMVFLAPDGEIRVVRDFSDDTVLSRQYHLASQTGRTLVFRFFLLGTTSLAWGVVLLHLLQWRWLLSGKGTQSL